MWAAMKFSPTKTTVLMKENPLDRSESYKTVARAGELSRHQIGLNAVDPEEFLAAREGLERPSTREAANVDEEGGEYVPTKEEDMSDRVTEGNEILVDDYGRPLVNRIIADLPDPRYREPAHLIFCLLWYGGAVGAIIYIAFVFATYTPEQTKTFPFTSVMDPMVNLRLELSCTSPSVSVTRTNYSNPKSRCYNMNSKHIPGPYDHDHGHGPGHTHSSTTRRGMEEQAHHLPAAFNISHFPAPVNWLKADAPTPLVTATKNINYDYAETLEVPLCPFSDVPYDSNWYWPEFPGVAVMFGNISYKDICSIDVYSTLPDQAGASLPLKRISVEGAVLKTVWIHYSEKRLKHEDKKLAAEWISVDFYELDGQRTFTDTATNTSIIRFRFTDTSTSILEFDMRSWVSAGGIFGSLWYLISNYFCFYAAPLLMCTFPRDFIADTKNGKLDGYTVNGLAQAWKPTVWLWIGGELVKRVKYAVS